MQSADNAEYWNELVQFSQGLQGEIVGGFMFSVVFYTNGNTNRDGRSTVLYTAYTVYTFTLFTLFTLLTLLALFDTVFTVILFKLLYSA